MNKKITKINLGFTLVEMMVAVSVTAILLGVGVAQYRKFSRTQLIKAAVRQLKSDLRVAQANALSGEKGSCACGKFGAICGDPRDPTILGWEVSFPSATSYEIYGLCQNGVTKFMSDGTLSTLSKSLPTNVSFTSKPAIPIRFKVLGGGTNLSGDATITLSGLGGITQSVMVTLGGEIKDGAVGGGGGGGGSPTATPTPIATPTPKFSPPPGPPPGFGT